MEKRKKAPFLACQVDWWPFFLVAFAGRRPQNMRVSQEKSGQGKLDCRATRITQISGLRANGFGHG